MTYLIRIILLSQCLRLNGFNWHLSNVCLRSHNVSAEKIPTLINFVKNHYFHVITKTFSGRNVVWFLTLQAFNPIKCIPSLVLHHYILYQSSLYCKDTTWWSSQVAGTNSDRDAEPRPVIIRDVEDNVLR